MSLVSFDSKHQATRSIFLRFKVLSINEIQVILKKWRIKCTKKIFQDNSKFYSGVAWNSLLFYVSKGNGFKSLRSWSKKMMQIWQSCKKFNNGKLNKVKIVLGWNYKILMFRWVQFWPSILKVLESVFLQPLLWTFGVWTCLSTHKLCYSRKN